MIAVTAIMPVCNSSKPHFILYIHIPKKIKSKPIKAAVCMYIIPLKPDDLTVLAKSFFAIFLNEYIFFLVSAENREYHLVV